MGRLHSSCSWGKVSAGTHGQCPQWATEKPFSLDPPVSAASSDNLNKDLLLPTPQPSVKYCVGERAATQRPRPDQGVKRYESDG